MNLKKLFGVKAAPVVNPAIEAMAARVSTLDGCQALQHALAQQLEQTPIPFHVSRLLRSQLEELQRQETRLKMEEDRTRVAGVVKRDQKEASKALQAADTKLKSAAAAAAEAADRRAERTGTIDELSRELASVQRQADEAVTAAENALREVITGDKSEASAEVEAFDVLKKAQLHRATCGEALAVRLKGHEAELRRLEAVANEHAALLQAAQDDVNLWRWRLARVEYDQAAQLLVDAFVKMRALPQADGAGKAFSGVALNRPDVTFASRDRAVLGQQICGETTGLREHALFNMVKALRPINVELLVQTPTAEIPQVEEPPRSPYNHTPGSVEFHNAQVAQERFSLGAEQHEANLRAEQRHPLQA